MGGSVKVAGNVPSPRMGMHMRFFGRYHVDPKYGIEFKADRSELAQTDKSIMKMLSGKAFKGIGAKTAEAIVQVFGDKALEVIEKTPERLTEIRGISRAKAEKMQKSLLDLDDEMLKLRKELFEMTNGEISEGFINRLIKKYGKGAPNKIRKNPYELIYEMDGIGFKKADQLAMAIGIPTDSRLRMGAVLVNILRTASSDHGHCFLDTAVLQETSLDFLAPMPKMEDERLEKEFRLRFAEYDEMPEEREKAYADFIKEYGERHNQVIPSGYGPFSQCKDWYDTRCRYIPILADALFDEIDAGRLYYDKEGDVIFWRTLYEAEGTCARKIAEMLDARGPKDTLSSTIDAHIMAREKSSGILLNDEQKDAVRCAVSSGVSVITGGPGRGKTTIIKYIISAYRQDDVFLCAPTGRAAQRMRDQTGMEACTVHAALRYFAAGLKSKKVIIDESSMLSVDVIAKLLDLMQGCSVVFVGDIDQLPPVGPRPCT